jgi:hypothetical protein
MEKLTLRLDCDGGTGTPGTKDHADIDLSDPVPLNCEIITHP